MQVVPRSGVWLPDELAVLQTAFGVLRKQYHRGISDEDFETQIVDDLMQSARDGCHDPKELVQRCRARMRSKRAAVISFGVE